MKNPLLEKWETPFKLPPFEQIRAEHFKPAIIAAIREAEKEVDEIAGNPDTPTFENTIQALDMSGLKLDEISSILFNLNSAETNREMQVAAQEVSPLLSKFSNDVTLNRALFERVKHVCSDDQGINLSTEQKMLQEKTYRHFIKGGAGLKEEKRERFRKINEDLAKLSLQFEENVLEETNAFFLHIKDRKDLEGLPEGVIEAAAEEAKNSGREGWVFTLHFPSYIPFMQYSARRELREKMYMAYSTRAFGKKKNDNRDIVRKIVNLRREKSNLLEFNNYAEYILADRMLNSPAKVTDFLNELLAESHKYALKDIEDVRSFAKDNGSDPGLESWDWAYYSEKLKKQKFMIDDELLRPYFMLERVEKAVFGLAGILYGLSFEHRPDLPLYHKDVRAFEVRDMNNEHLAVLYLDYYPRKGKSGGAWMTAYRDQFRYKNYESRPVISVVTNFSKPSSTRPALLTHTELTTLMHEFGHALHGMLTRCNYRSLSGTNVARDFVELPSQIMENWAFEKEWLDTWALHYKTGEKIPEEYIIKIRESMVFNEGYACNRQLGFGFLDMALHSLERKFDDDIDQFERQSMKKTELLQKTEGTNISCSFGHLFSGGYAAGYYGYKWSEVLDADAFSLFREKGIFDRETADSFRINILEKGETEEPMTLYKKFRGKEPSIDALLIRSGFKEAMSG